MAATFALRALRIEAERKFHPCAFSCTAPYLKFRQEPKFKSLNFQGTSCFTDIYYDRPGFLLMKQGIYVRSRDGQWEAKHGNSGDYNTSQFEEMHSSKKIAELIKKAVDSASYVSEANNFDLTPVAHFTTRRVCLVADDRFTIALDDMDFGHSVGEVELLEDFQYENNESMIAKIMMIQNKKALLRQEIECFMRQYGWAFPTTTPDGQPVHGKLTRYFEMQRMPQWPKQET
ncbi:MAG: hypothetical protein Q9227_004103 [Pyrenula ochraceoflavens]